jgi:hypothetical protein
LKNVFIEVAILLPRLPHLIEVAAATIASEIPFMVLPNTEPVSPASQSVKNLLIPAASESPRFVKLNLSRNASAAFSTVLTAPEIVPPRAENSSGLMRPFRKLARPVPKSLDFWYISFHLISPSPL